MPLLAERMRKVELPVSVDDSFHAVHHLGVIGGDVMRLLAKESDDALGPHNLGVSYELGLTSPQPRLPDAVRSYKQAARCRGRKFVPSQYALARLYLNAARSGSIEAKRALKVYEEDSLITEGLKWLHLAAQSNFAKAQAFYAALYTEGLFGLKADSKQAEHCLRKAIETGWPVTAGIPTVETLLNEHPQFEPFLSDHLTASAHTADKLLRHKSEVEDKTLLPDPISNRVDYEIDQPGANKFLPRLRLTTVSHTKVPSLNVPSVMKLKESHCSNRVKAADFSTSNAPTVRIESAKNSFLVGVGPNEAGKFYTARESERNVDSICQDCSASTTTANISLSLLTESKKPESAPATRLPSPAWESGLRCAKSEGQAGALNASSQHLTRRRGMSSAAALQMAPVQQETLIHKRTTSADRLHAAPNRIYTSTYSDISSSEDAKPPTRATPAGAAFLTASRLKHLNRLTDEADGEVDESTADGPRSVSASEVRGVTWDDLNNMPDSTVHQRWLEAYSLHDSAMRSCASGDDFQEWLPKLAQSYCLQSLAVRREPEDIEILIDRSLERVQKVVLDRVFETQALFVWLNRYLHSLSVTEDEPPPPLQSPIAAPSDSLSRALSRLTEVVGLVSVDMTTLEHSPIQLWNLLVLRAALKSRCFGYTKGALDDLTMALECCPDSRKYEIHLAAIRATLLESGSGALPSETSVAFLKHLDGYVNLAPTHDRWPVTMSLEPIVGGMSERQRKQMAALVCKLEKRCVFQPPECKRPDVPWLFKLPSEQKL